MLCMLCGVGMNSIGILSGGGLGRVMAHWMVNGKPDVDVTGMNIDRFHKYVMSYSVGQ
jgi:glycine/D-amino acid oxidase-like deaminating enzyme